MGIGDLQIEGGGRVLAVLIAIAIGMAMNPYVGLAILPIVAIAIAIPQVQFGEGFNPFTGFLEGRLRHIKSRYGHHYGGIAKAGSFGVVEAFVFIAYVFCAADLVGLISISLGASLKTIAVIIVVVAGIILLAQKAHLKFTALEMATFAIAVGLPILASGILGQNLTLPSNWLATAWDKIAIWGISCASCVIMAFQD